MSRDISHFFVCIFLQFSLAAILLLVCNHFAKCALYSPSSRTCARSRSAYVTNPFGAVSGRDRTLVSHARWWSVKTAIEAR